MQAVKYHLTVVNRAQALFVCAEQQRWIYRFFVFLL